MKFDVVILGSGFAGSLLGLILQKQGLSVLVVDRARHPRFAIGESSTPAADFILESLCERYDLKAVKPLCRYGSWYRERPLIARGLKRGFSYYHHRAGTQFTPGDNHANELLVAASASDEVGDTHWYRADVDHFLANQFQDAGGELWENSTVDSALPGHRWSLTINRSGQSEAVETPFLIDGTGSQSALVRWLNLEISTASLKTHSRSLFSHFEDVDWWSDCLGRQGIDQAQYPYLCDHAALHHLIDGGWMWVLRFDNGSTSVGWSLDPHLHPLREDQTPSQEWNELLKSYPGIAEQLRSAYPAPAFANRPEPIIRTGRLQRRVTPAAGENWALLPHTAGFIDPFYSTGIAHSLLGVERLASILVSSISRRAADLVDYSRAMDLELGLIDRLVSLAFQTMGQTPELLHAVSMLYFAAATTFESRRKAGAEGLFLLADDRDFNQVVTDLASVFPSHPHERDVVQSWCQQVQARIAPWNRVGLFTPRFRNMYWQTAAEKSSESIVTPNSSSG